MYWLSILQNTALQTHRTCTYLTGPISADSRDLLPLQISQLLFQVDCLVSILLLCSGHLVQLVPQTVNFLSWVLPFARLVVAPMVSLSMYLILVHEHGNLVLKLPQLPLLPLLRLKQFLIELFLFLEISYGILE